MTQFALFLLILLSICSNLLFGEILRMNNTANKSSSFLLNKIATKAYKRNDILKISRSRRNIKIEEDIQLNAKKQLTSDEVELIDPVETKNKATHKVFDQVCHICTKESITDVPVVENEINFNPDFTKTEEPCSDNENMMCTNVKIDLKNIFKVHTKIVGTERKIKVSYECCPGWKNTSINCCMEPICSQNCFNGEICVGPDICECPQGKICKKDSGLCETLKPCDHLCLDIKSSFMCFCKHGYVLGPDQRSCITKYKDSENYDSSEIRDLAGGFNSTILISVERLEKMEKMIETNKKALEDLNKKLHQTFLITDFLNTRISILEEQCANITQIKERISSNEKNIKKFLKFANILWKSNRDNFKQNLFQLTDDEDTSKIENEEEDGKMSMKIYF